MLRRKAINRREKGENNTQRATEKPKYLELCVSLRKTLANSAVKMYLSNISW